MAAWELPAARKEGLGLTAMGRAGLYERILVASAVLALTVCLAIGATPQRFMLVAGAGIVAGMGVPRILSKQVGGMTGDLFGATVLLVETVVLVMGAVM
jgi:adenosylcobinamide-GDP ribazoletransferase